VQQSELITLTYKETQAFIQLL